MATLAQLIRKNKQNPIRRCYIKRRDFGGSYESSWVQIDNWKNRDRVLSWGNISIEINHQPAQISTFQVTNLSLVFDNSQGHFNNEEFRNSIFYGFIGRKYTKLKIECGYFDSDGSEIGVANVFEGVIDSVKIGEDQKARINILSYQTILKKFDIKDLSLASADRTVENLLADIMNQSKITTFIPYVAADPDIADVTIDDPSALEGTYWDNILYFAQITNSIPLLVGDTWSFESRDPSVSSEWDFTGFGSDRQPDIFKINSYDDEGADKVRLRFQEQDGSTVAISTDTLLLNKYLGDTTDGSEVEFIDLSEVVSADKQSVLDTLLDYWQNPRPTIEFTTRFMVNELKPTDRITIDFRQKTIPSTGIFTVGLTKIGTVAAGGSGHVIAKKVGAINISSGIDWMITKISKNINDWTSVIKAEKVV